MRLNLPVTGRRYAIAPGSTLVSTTDLKGRITHCNPAFIEVSGYDKDELLGQPHNLIRHPDMPSEAFRDLWATIQSGARMSKPGTKRYRMCVRATAKTIPMMPPLNEMTTASVKNCRITSR